MRDANMIVRERQLAIRREMDRRSISLKAVSFDSGIPYATIVSYFPGEKNKEPATIGAAALFLLCEGVEGKGPALPLDLLSELLPASFAIVRQPENLDHDEYETMCRDYLAAKAQAHKACSPAGREISDCEREALDSKVVHLKAAA